MPRQLLALLFVVLSVGCPRPQTGSGAVVLDAFAWTRVSPLAQGRLHHTATPLNDGRVLVAGGEYQAGALWKMLRSAEVYDPEQASWTATGDMGVYRTGHTATLLPDGGVLVVGGQGGDDAARKVPVASVELYKPYAGRWVTAADLNTPRYDHTATLLSDGRVLVVGGVSTDGIAPNEVYDTRTGRWTALAPLRTPRRDHIAVELEDGRVLVAGGLGDAGVLSTVEIFDPKKNRWIDAPDLLEPRDGHTAVRLDDGRVLVAGGYQLVGYAEAELPTTEIFDPIRNEWTPAAPLGSARRGHTSAVLPGGAVLVVGGSMSQVTVGTPEVFEPAHGTWSALPVLPERLFGAATVLTGHHVLVVGGWNQFDTHSEVALVLGPTD